MVVAAVLRDSLCVVSLLPCVADCCNVERFVLTIIKRSLFIIIILLLYHFTWKTGSDTREFILLVSL